MKGLLYEMMNEMCRQEVPRLSLKWCSSSCVSVKG